MIALIDWIHVRSEGEEVTPGEFQIWGLGGEYSSGWEIQVEVWCKKKIKFVVTYQIRVFYGGENPWIVIYQKYRVHKRVNFTRPQGPSKNSMSYIEDKNG